MKFWGNVVALVLLVIGAIWMLQGANILGGSFMTGQSLCGNPKADHPPEVSHERHYLHIAVCLRMSRSEGNQVADRAMRSKDVSL